MSWLINTNCQTVLGVLNISLVELKSKCSQGVLFHKFREESISSLFRLLQVTHHPLFFKVISVITLIDVSIISSSSLCFWLSFLSPEKEPYDYKQSTQIISLYQVTPLANFISSLTLIPPHLIALFTGPRLKCGHYLGIIISPAGWEYC